MLMGFLSYILLWPLAELYFKFAFSLGFWSFFVVPIGAYILYQLFFTSLRYSSKIAYRFCWSERDACKFVETIKDDPDWKDVIQVEFLESQSTPLERKKHVDALISELLGKLR